MNIYNFLQNNNLNSSESSEENKRNEIEKAMFRPTSIMRKMIEEDARDRYSITSKEAEKYNKYGLNYDPKINMDAALADAQSNWAKAFNALGQTVVSEIGLGTVKGFADIFDFISSSVLGITEDDYQNPVSELMQQWQDKFNEEVAPIYANPEVNIQNGGLKDFGWWMKNLPQVASTLTLLIPTKTISTGLSLLAKGTRLGRKANVGLRNTRRFATGIKKAQSANELKAWQVALNNPRNLAKANYGAQLIGEGLLMRTIENYQEARDTHIQTYQNALETLERMDEDRINNWLESNPELAQELKDKGINANDKDGIAKHIAKKAADRTFSMDFSNAIFDIIQLHTLNNVGKGIKKATGRKIRNAQKESISAAEQIAGGATGEAASQAAKEATKVGFLSKVGNGVKDFVKYNAKTALLESTEGIEEAVNYIAQQEGITYGKMLLENNHDVYDYNRFTGIWGSWSNMQNDLNNYLKTAELQESAFWGVMGGLVFQGAGNITNKASLALHRRAEKKEAEKRAKETGESVKVPNDYDSLSTLFETEETRIGKVGINKRLAHLNDFKSKIDAIERGEDPFNIDENGRRRQFSNQTQEGLEFQKQIARERAVNEFRSAVAVDAINSGTFDLLVDYFRSDAVKKAMVKVGASTESEIDGFTEETVRALNEVKEIYDRQGAHVLNQIAAINATRGDAEDISLQYAQQIATDNTNALLNIKAIDKEINVTNELIRQQEEQTTEKHGVDAIVGARETIKTGVLIDLYSKLDAKQRALENETIDDSMEALAVGAEINNIKQRKKQILKELSQITPEGGTPLANIVYALKKAKTYNYDKTQLNVNDGFSEDLNYDFSSIDAEITKNARDIFKELTGKESEVEDDVIKNANDVFTKNYNRIADKQNGLLGQNTHLFGLYASLSYLEASRGQAMSTVADTRAEIADRVNYYHNIYNEARRKAIDKAEKIIRNAYVQYEGVEEEGGRPLIDALIEAYHGDKTKARQIAEQYMSDKSDNFVTAAEFLDALDIFNLNSHNNNLLYTVIADILSKAKQNLKQKRPVTILEDEETEVAEGTETAPTEIGTEEPINNRRKDTAPKKVKVITNNKGDIVSIKGKTDGNFDAYIYENEDGTFELDVASLPKSEQLKYARQGYINIDDNVDLSDENSKWEVSENPILVKTNQGYTLAKNGEGLISLVEDETSSPVERNDEETSTEAPASEDTSANTTEETQPDTSLFGQDFNVDNETKKAEEELAQSNPSTGEQSQPSITDKQLAQAAKNSFFTKLPMPLTDFNFDIEAVSRLVKAELKETDPTGKVTEEQIDRVVDAIVNDFIEARNRLSELNDPIQKTGSALAFACRVEESDNNDYSNLLYASVNDFMKEYEKIVLVPRIEGKQLVRLEDVLRICNNVYATSDTTVAKHMYHILKSYFDSPEGKSKYIVVDSSKGTAILDNLTKTPQEITNEYLIERGFRVNVNDIINSLEDPELIKKFNEAFDSLNVGDKLQLLVTEGELTIVKDDTIIGSLAMPGKLNEDTFVQVNDGWITDVKRDGQGNIISKSKDKIVELFTGTTKDHDNLRLLLETIALNGGKITQSDITTFEQNPLINALYNQARLIGASYNNILFVDKKTKNIDSDRVLKYLSNLWRYTQDSQTGYNTQDRLDEVRLSLDRWFNILYDTYSAVSSIKENTEVEVASINDGEFIRATDLEGDEKYDKFLTPKEGLDPTLDVRIGIVDPRGSGDVLISNKANLPKESFGTSGTVLAVFSRNLEPELIEAYGLKLTDATNIPSDFRTIMQAAHTHLLRAVEKIRLEKGKGNNIKEVEEVIRNIISIRGDYNRVPLYRALQGQLVIQDVKTNNDTDNRSGIEIVHYVNGRVARNVKIFDYGTKFKQIGIQIKDFENSANNVTQYYNVNDASSSRSLVTDFLTKFVIPNFNVNIDGDAIRYDYKANTDFNGYINKKDGKLQVNIPNGDNTNTTLEYDSYSDFLVKGNLIKINAKKNEKGRNFERQAKNQKNNQFLSIHLPINQSTNKNGNPNVNLDSKDVLDKNAHEETYSNVKQIIKENGDNVGERILEEALGKDKFEEFKNEQGADFLHSILPNSIAYIPESNFRTSDGWNGAVASTRVPGFTTYKRFSKNGNPRYEKIPSNIDTIVGTYWMNMISSRDLWRRGAAVRALIHERLHTNIHNLPQAEQDKLFNSIEEVYNAYAEQLKKDRVEGNPRYDIYKTVGVQTENSLKGYNNDRNRRLEEFLVESLTNSNFFKYLNSIETQDADNGKKDNLFTKIAKLIAKIFGFETKDNTLYMKQLNILRDVFDGGTNNSNEVTTSETTESTETTETQEQETQEETTKQETDEGIEIVDEDSNNYVREADDNVDTSEDDDTTYNEDDDYDDESFRQNYEEINVSQDGFNHVQNFDAFQNSLPLETQSQFKALRDMGLLEYKCR